MRIDRPLLLSFLVTGVSLTSRPAIRSLGPLRQATAILFASEGLPLDPARNDRFPPDGRLVNRDPVTDRPPSVGYALRVFSGAGSASVSAPGRLHQRDSRCYATGARSGTNSGTMRLSLFLNQND